MGPDRSRESQGRANTLTKATYLDSIPHINSIHLSKHFPMPLWTGLCWACRNRGKGLAPPGSPRVARKTQGRRLLAAGGQEDREEEVSMLLRLGSRQAGTRHPSRAFSGFPKSREALGVGQVPALLLSSHLRSERKLSLIEKHSGHMKVSSHSHWGCQHAVGVSRFACM